ncbi:MAG: putative MPP superfamily phosphohydrolase, partial [Pirellulaceae bacterium]
LAYAVIAFGHIGLWVLFWNHVEGSGRRKEVRKIQRYFAMACVLGLPLWFATQSGWPGDALWWENTWTLNQHGVAAYAIICCYITLAVTPYAIVGRYIATRPKCQRIVRTKRHSVENNREQAPNQTKFDRFLLNFPGNQSLEIELATKCLELEKLPRHLDALTIAHISDLHVTGKIGRDFFEKIVDLTNEQSPDLVAITGDLIDVEEYMSWLPATLGRLKSRHGIYFVLGNHDVKVDVQKLRRTLENVGLRDIASTWQKLSINNCNLIIAGNEQPWLGSNPDMSECPRSENQFRLLLAHTPDLLPWARTNDFDLMLAGHTHNGQICPPVTGPIFCPSRAPLPLVAGTVHLPPTVMHVSRGLSAEKPIRINSCPELAILHLVCPPANVNQQIEQDIQIKEPHHVEMHHQIENRRKTRPLHQSPRAYPNDNDGDVEISRHEEISRT